MSDIEKKVIAVVLKQLSDIEPNKVTPDAKFADDLGADSLDQVEMVMAFEEEFGVEIPDHVAEKIVKISDAIHFIEEQLKKAA